MIYNTDLFSIDRKDKLTIKLIYCKNIDLFENKKFLLAAQ